MPYPVSITAADLNTEFAVWRATIAKDKVGGRDATRSQVGTVWGKLNQPTAAESTTAQQPEASHTQVIHFLPVADVERGDELRTADDTFKVIATRWPSTRTYLAAQVESDESEQGVES